MKYKVGTRASALSVAQTRDALERISAILPFAEFELVTFSSPGDRDRETDLRVAPANFFSRDLDEALLTGAIDIAVHSAKDLPGELPEGIDYFHLPWREDRRDCWVFPEGADGDDVLAGKPIVGVSSQRRVDYLQRCFPAAEAKPIRGTIEQRIAQLDGGAFDAIITAVAALKRLKLEGRIGKIIEEEELEAPEGQGVLAVTFRQNDRKALALRDHFVKAVRFVGGGVSSAALCTLGGIEDLQHAEVCLYDDLMDEGLLKFLPSDARAIHVGKRCGAHSSTQSEINSMISRFAKCGLRTVRLKGGDPGLFGRLAEEIEELEKFCLPYTVRPGVSALSAATTGTGMLLTKRGVSRGFTVMTPRAEGGKKAEVGYEARKGWPLALFMSVKMFREVADALIADGLPGETPAAVVYAAGGEEERIVRGTLSGLCPPAGESAPGLILIGENVRLSYRREDGVLQGRRVLLTGSAALAEKSARAVVDFGGRPIVRPMIELKACAAAKECIGKVQDFDWLILTSPSAVRLFFELFFETRADVRRLPRIAVCGKGCAEECMRFGVHPDLMPEGEYSASAMIGCFQEAEFRGKRVLRLRSEKAGREIAQALIKLGADVQDVILYENIQIGYPSLPEFDAVFFASASGVESFVEQFGTEVLRGKAISVLGGPTARALERAGVGRFVVALQADVVSAIRALGWFGDEGDL